MFLVVVVAVVVVLDILFSVIVVVYVEFLVVDFAIFSKLFSGYDDADDNDDDVVVKGEMCDDMVILVPVASFNDDTLLGFSPFLAVESPNSDRGDHKNRLYFLKNEILSLSAS